MTRRLVNIMDMPDPTEIEAALLPCPLCQMHLRPAADPRMSGMLEHPPHIHCPISALCFLDTPSMRAAWNGRHPPASREEGLREALQYVASYAETRREHHAPEEVANAFDDIAKRARRALIPAKPEAKEQEDALYENLPRAELADTVARYGKALSEIANFSPKSDGFSAPTETAAFCQERARSALQSKKPE